MSQDRIEDVLKDIKSQLIVSNSLANSLATASVHTGNEMQRVFMENHVCTDNSTTTLLGTGATFLGDWQDCLNFQEVNVAIKSDKNSATNGLVMQWSPDQTVIGDTDSFSYYATLGGTNYTPNPAFRYFRISYTNGSARQTQFSLQTILRRGMTGGSFHRVDSTLRDDSDGRLVLAVPKLKTASNTWVSQSATNNGNAKMSLEELESGVSVNSNSQLKVSIYGTTGNDVEVCPRKQTPTGNAMQVQIGPGDIVSNLPVTVDFDHHQVHEGETYHAIDQQLSLGTNTVKYSFKVPNVTADATRCPHLIISGDIYNGSARIDMYAEATATLGSAMTIYNKERNSANTSSVVLKTGVTSTNGNLIDSFFVGQGSRNAGSNRAQNEWVLKSNATYRIDVVGLVTGTQSIVKFEWYEDRGV